MLDWSELSLTGKQAGLRAMKEIAAANGTFADEEKALIEAAGHAVGVEVRVDALEAIAPDELAKTITSPDWRRRVIQALVITALVDGEATADETKRVDDFARALEIDDPFVKNLHRLLAGHMLGLRIDIVRRIPVFKQIVGSAWKEEGVRGVLSVMRAFRGKEIDPDLAWRYKQLGLLPEGTLGREFWKHMTERKFAFPGETGGIHQRGIHHDFTHVLTGYDTDPNGETQVAGFVAGMMGEDAFPLVFGTLLMFQLGIRLSPIATPSHHGFDPTKVVAAVERGARCNVQLWEGWDMWAVADVPIGELRARYNIA